MVPIHSIFNRRLEHETVLVYPEFQDVRRVLRVSRLEFFGALIGQATGYFSQLVFILQPAGDSCSVCLYPYMTGLDITNGLVSQRNELVEPQRDVWVGEKGT